MIKYRNREKIKKNIFHIFEITKYRNIYGVTEQIVFWNTSFTGWKKFANTKNNNNGNNTVAIPIKNAKTSFSESFIFIF